MHRVCDIGAVYAVVIRNSGSVVIFHRCQVGKKNLGLYLQLSDETQFLLPSKQTSEV